ncbi:hypothetical protein [Secundilactobacillus silagei]|uniref:Small membrane protein n=1 Tax=Secundilactobacillus silagei JCM 19001 TaxID=1302250 RepID=A0A1Z5IJI0_9LACO|nr:hypothetical protein [Secundilactobacillus silagei]TDG68705.1 hypothetical protein C5L25_001781 [Secundilactobacillus silagei JCM 19001]GAX01846.1 small membrane protein [Secundilactobacillus silagei JCM 19001]
MSLIAYQDDDQRADDGEQPLSRSAYREAQRKKQEDFDRRDHERLKAEKRYAKQHSDPEYDQKQQDAVTADKIGRLKRRLNWTIGWLIVGIVAVFLILFFVEF